LESNQEGWGECKSCDRKENETTLLLVYDEKIQEKKTIIYIL
jgi:hypothetical protein